jgi:hypothetical protein
MSTKHTPGPWFIRREPDPQRENGWMLPHDWLIEQDAGEGFGRWIATFPRLVDGEQEQQIADAHLIAAAPDLLAAAEQALELLRTGAPGWGVAKDILNAAIAKATGEPHA